MPDIFINKPSIKPEEKSKTKFDEAGFIPPAEMIKRIESGKYIHRHEFHKHSPLSSHCYFPEGIKFIAKDSQEKIVLFLRKHPITNLPWILVAILLLFAPAVLQIFPVLAGLPDNFQLIAVCIWYLLVVAYIFESFLSWFFNVFIVTDERVFDVDFLNLVYREISEANIEQIQDVTTRMGSVIRTIFNYGDVFIQTASEIPRIEFEAVPNPDLVARVLRELRVEEEQEKIEGRVR